MSNLRALAIFQMASGLAEDRVVNTFYFSNEDLYDVHSVNVNTALQDFYNGSGVAGTDEGQTRTISTVLGSHLNRSAEIRTYDMDTGSPTEPRNPTIYEMTLDATRAFATFPDEVALACSFATTFPNTGRRRGRVFLGPFDTATADGGNGGGPSRPGAGLRADIARAAKRLALNPLNVGWSIHSGFPTPNGSYYPVVRGWVDDSWDTIRKRGPDPIARNEWTTV